MHTPITENLLVTGPTHDLGGGFVVRRLLPTRKKRMVGPFIFLDHMGPVEFAPNSKTDVRPHPHIGLSTLTYLFEGRMMHRDSLGNQQLIAPGEVNWMTAGKAIAHSERAHPEDYGKKIKMEGLQIWVALPDETEDQEPSFRHYDRTQLGEHTGAGFKATVVAGTAFGVSSKVAVTSPSVLVDVRADSNSEIAFKPDSSDYEIAVYVITGQASVEGFAIESGAIGILTPRATYPIQAQAGTHLIIIGGEAFQNPKHIYWNFVSSSKEKIEAAKCAWKEEKFPLIPGDDQERIPLGD